MGAMRALAATAGALTLLAGAILSATARATTAAHRVHAGAKVSPRHQLHGRHGKAPARASIIGGSPAESGTYPWLAYIIDQRGRCSGTVVAPTLILTAGHCAEDIETGVVNAPSGYTVVTGNVNWTSPERQVSAVSRVIPYPGFVPSAYYGDAALLELSTPTRAPAIGLAADLGGMPDGTAALIAGWGLTYYEQAWFTAQLQWAGTVVKGPAWCEQHAVLFSSAGKLCSINPPSYRTGACFGDSGGPLLAQWPSGGVLVQIGITSTVYGACSTTHPTVFTRADLVASWVHGWIEAVKPTPAPPSTPTPAPVRTQAPTSPPARQTLGPPARYVPPNAPGSYVARRSHGREIVIHVSADGNHIVGLSIKMTVQCRHGYHLPLEASFLSYARNLTITNHAARETLEMAAGGEYKAGHVGFSAQFTAPGSLTGRLRVRIPTRSRKLGLCAATLKFTAKT
jgi:hypothetical protein